MCRTIPRKPYSVSTRLSSFRELLEIDRPKWPTSRNRLMRVLDLLEMREMAKRALPKFAFDYFDGSAFREYAAKRNRMAFQRSMFRPRVLVGVDEASPRHEFLGTEYGLPIGIAPTGLTALAHPDGELAGVRAARELNAPFVLSTMSTYSIEEIAAAEPDADRWFQLYLRKERQESLELVERAAAAGYSKLVLTVDTAVGGRRLRDNRNGLSLPPKLSINTAVGSLMHPAWTLRFLNSGAPKLANFSGVAGDMSEIVSQMFDAGQNWEDFDLIRSRWRGDLVVKGVLDPLDAKEFVRRGANAIWVSNHGGRQLDRAVSPIEVVGAVRSAVGPDVPIILDSGILSGSDVLTALGAGADYTFLGRGYIYGLAAGGQDGVSRVFEIFREEMLNSMQLLGVSRLRDISQSNIVS